MTEAESAPVKSLPLGSSPLGPSIQLRLTWDCGNALSDIIMQLILHQHRLTKYIFIVPNLRRPFRKPCHLIIPGNHQSVHEAANSNHQQIFSKSTYWSNDWEKMSWYWWICDDGKTNRCSAWWSKTCLIKQMNSFCSSLLITPNVRK